MLLKIPYLTFKKRFFCFCSFFLRYFFSAYFLCRKVFFFFPFKKTGRRKELLGQISRKMHYCRFLYQRTPNGNTFRGRYCCRFCTYNSNYPTNLKSHEAVHLGFRPFQCKICSKRFVQKMHLQRHLATHYKMSI
ncbi:unnamed protein product [Larinioides sclopetarius]|uniref:C2H2-type domain-containing protein n=1 Tax=Larinioides sclopetarius TaxID=280406 RepID=A0AAV1ZBM4_9ARAC